MTLHLEMPAGPMAATAGAMMRAAADRLSDINDEVAHGVAAAHLTRSALGDLIERLIMQLDEIEPDADLEDADEDCDALLERGEGDPLDLYGEHALASTMAEDRTEVFSLTGEHDQEPSLGSQQQYLSLSQVAWGHGGDDDQEIEDHGGESDDWGLH